jgi:hypothetical protein
VNRQDAVEVLGVLGAAWPNQEIAQQTAQLWLGMLDACEVEAAKKAALSIIRNDHWFPSVARFLQSYESEAQYQRTARADSVGLPTAHHTPVAPPKRLTDASRVLLREMGGRGHWHGGPGPCPKCGGMAPTPKEADD